MIWPPKTIHGSETHWSKLLNDGEWRAPHADPAMYGRTCPYCGSINPEDLLTALQAGARLEMADWKYGFPHKYYVWDIPNPRAGELRVVMSKWENGVLTEEKAPAGLAWAKFYSVHLNDPGFDDEAFKALTSQLQLHVPEVTWERDEKGAKWSGRRPHGVR